MNAQQSQYLDKYTNLDRTNVQLRAVDKDEKVMLVKRTDAGEEHITTSTLNEFLDSMIKLDYSITLSKTYNRVYLYKETNGKDYAMVVEYYTIN